MAIKPKPIPVPVAAVFDKHGIPEERRHGILKQWRESTPFNKDALVAEYAMGKDPKEKTGTVLAIVIDGCLARAEVHRKRLARVNDARIEHAKEFRAVFGVNLKDFWGALGFDVVAFDVNFIKSPDRFSCAEAIRAKYGDRAVQIVRDLMGDES